MYIYIYIYTLIYNNLLWETHALQVPRQKEEHSLQDAKLAGARSRARDMCKLHAASTSPTLTLGNLVMGYPTFSLHKTPPRFPLNWGVF